MKFVGIDLGRGRTKGVCGNRRVWSSSILGEESKTTYGGILDAEVSLNGTATVVEHPELGHVVREIGDSALAHSDNYWSPRWRDQRYEDLVVLMSHMFRQLDISGEVVLCVGTPAQYYDRDRAMWGEAFTKAWYVNGQEVSVVRTCVMPQPAGAAWHLAVNQQGNVREGAIFDSKVAIIDGGEYTTDGGVLFNMKWQGARVITRERGVGKIKEAIVAHLTGLGQPREPYEVDEALQKRGIRLDRGWVDLSDVIDRATEFQVNAILAEFGARWPDRAEYDRIIVEGGLAYYAGELIRDRWGPVVEFDLGTPGPEWWNVLGFHAYLQFRRKEAERHERSFP